MKILRTILAFAFCSGAVAQIVAPQIPLTGNVGTSGFPLLNTGTITITDANYFLSPTQTSAIYIKVISSVPLTATRTFNFPAGRFSVGIENATTGGQSISVCGATGSCVTVPNSTTAYTPVWNDGTNFIQGAPPSTGGSSSASPTNSIQAADGAGNFISNGVCIPSYGRAITDCTAGYFANITGTNGGIWHTGLPMNTGTPSNRTPSGVSSGNIDIRQNGLWAGLFGLTINGSFLGDYNSIINNYSNMRIGNVNYSDEGHYLRAEARTYFCQNVAQYCNMYFSTITAVNQPIPNGPSALTLATPTGSAGIRMTNDTLLMDQTSPITATLTFTATVSAGAPLPITISASSATIPVSISGTLNANTTWAPASLLDVTPTLTTFAITTAGAVSPAGTEMCFADSNVILAECMPIVSASLAGGIETISAYLMRPHYTGAQVYIGGLAGYAYELTAYTFSGQKYAFEIYGTTSSTVAVGGTRALGQYALMGQSGPSNIYPATRIATTFTSPGVAPTGTYAQIMPPATALNSSGASFTPFGVGSVVSNPGVPSQRFNLEQTQVIVDDPFATMSGDAETYAGHGMNWGYPLHNYYFNAAGTGVPPELMAIHGAVADGFHFQYQMYGGASPTVGLPACDNTFFCIYNWDSAGPEHQYLFQAPGFAMEALFNPQVVNSCSITSNVGTLNGTFPIVPVVGMPIYVFGFSDGAGGCQDINSGGNITNLYVLSASSTVITFSTTHANVTGSANAGTMAYALYDFHGGQDSLNVAAVGAKRFVQNGNLVCDASGTVTGCAGGAYTCDATGVFCADTTAAGCVSGYTAADCAYYNAYNYVIAHTNGATVKFGAGVYQKNIVWQLNPAGSNGQSVNLIGEGPHATYLSQNTSISSAMLTTVATGGNYPSLIIRGISFAANSNAVGCWNFPYLINTTVYDSDCSGVPTGAGTFNYKIGASSSGNAQEVHLFNVTASTVGTIYGFLLYMSDSTCYDCYTSNTGAGSIGIQSNWGNTVFIHAHPTGTQIGLQVNSNDVVESIECDTIYTYCIDYENALAVGSSQTNTHAFNMQPGSKVIHFGLSATPTASILGMGNFCTGNSGGNVFEVSTTAGNWPSTAISCGVFDVNYNTVYALNGVTAGNILINADTISDAANATINFNNNFNNQSSNFIYSNGYIQQGAGGGVHTNFTPDSTESRQVGTAVASASAVTIVAPVTHVTGTAAIATITLPTGCAYSSGHSCTFTLIADGAFTYTAAGNIAIASGSAATVGKGYVFIYDQATGKVYPQ